MFIDIVRFTKFGNNEALREAVRRLQDTLTDVMKKVVWDRQSDVEPNGAIMMPTGDGYGIGFEPGIAPDEDVLKYAAAISNAMKKKKYPVRIGISRGVCYTHEDLNDHLNLCGWGVISAERTMSCGEKNHILCNSNFVEFYTSNHTDPNLHPIGKYTIKHGKKIEVYNYFSGDFGNEEKPKK